jgi:SSS family solute:Na+ symporter
MMGRHLPAGLLGLAIVGLMAAFMSTVDTHINLAASFFVNDIWRRFLRPAAGVRELVLVGRLASAGVLGLALLLALRATSIRDLFMFFLAFLSGVGPVYVLRWLWWRVRAVHEIVAMVASALTTVLLTFTWPTGWASGALAPGGALSAEGRLCLVVSATLLCVFLSMPFVPRPDPATLTDFYRRVKPMGWWGPVAALAPDVRRTSELLPILVGIFGGLAFVWGAMIGAGLWLLERGPEARVAAVLAAAGAAGVWWAMGRLTATPAAPSSA